MADVNPVSRLVGDDRGQLFLVTALAIAVLLVSLALILNTAIYTENIATRTTDTQLDDAVTEQRAVVAASETMLDAENRNGGSESEIGTRFESSLANWSETAGTLEAANGFTIDVSYTGTNTTGIRVHQDDPARNFTDNSLDDSWEVVDSGRVRGIRFDVSRDNLSTTESNAFNVEVDDQDGVGDEATVSMYTDGTNVVVTVENDTESLSCSVEPTDGESLVVDIGSETVGTRYCPALEIVHDEADGEVDIWFDNAENATGTYELYTTNDDDDLDDLFSDADFASVGSGEWPVKQPALYDVTVRFVFQSSGTTVEKEIRITPGDL
ncbi:MULTISPECIES: hypothetical protein [Haloferax]|uniref:Uncharacterized protein n=1 Tax=Haloferax marinum TaxID=2666143 RepID=A0A6A8G3A9_9EURY|nr:MULTISPECIES: hypothetical protein [Haloferax]KAB1196617.1 hypothetical protein Hfx1150_03415 [Haloferax sp. CBA1150]MRW95621.1 hypothetical protein [Haloferax marinum]